MKNGMMKRLSVLLLTVVVLAAMMQVVAFADTDVGPLSVSGCLSRLTASGTSLSIFAYTQSSQTEDTISVTSTLQAKNGTSWRNVYTWPTVTKTSASYVSLSKTYTGYSGNIYRVKSTHYTAKGSVTDTEISYSAEVTVP